MNIAVASLSEKTTESMILVGRIGAPWGIKGHTRVQSFTSPEADILEYSTWYIKVGHERAKPVVVVDKNKHPKHLVARLEGVVDRDQAQALVHAQVFVSKDDLSDCEEGEYYWLDLIGLEVTNLQGHIFGCVDSLYETGVHDNMIVKKDKDSVHIPFVIDKTVMKVDLQAKKIIVDWDLGE